MHFTCIGVVFLATWLSYTGLHNIIYMEFASGYWMFYHLGSNDFTSQHQYVS